MERNNRIEAEVLGDKEKNGDVEIAEKPGSDKAALIAASSEISESQPGRATTGCG